MKKHIIMVVVFMALFVLGQSLRSAQAEEASLTFPLRLPFSYRGEISAANGDIGGEILASGYIEQGVDWIDYGKWTLNTFAGVRFYGSNRDDYYWNNKIGYWLGAKVKRPIDLPEGFWGGIAFGVRTEYYGYFSSRDETYGLNLFAQWGLGGDWKKLQDNPEDLPLGYPFSTWGSIGHATKDLDDGTVLSGYVEQGVDWIAIKKWKLNSFIGFRFVESDQDDYWNNKIGPWIGIKIHRPFKQMPISWGHVALGVRAALYRYTEATRDNDHQFVAFLQWSFGGDLRDWSNK